jgi:hypothetical protein
MEDLDSIPTFTVTAPENTPPLTELELENAKKELKIEPYPVFNKRFSDEFVKKHDPQYALFSFIPRINEKLLMFYKEIRSILSEKQRKKLDELIDADKYVHGVGKIRGAYNTLLEAENASDDIIKNIDSSNSVFICKIGDPFPLVVKGFAGEVKKVDVKNIIEQSMLENIRQKRAREQKEIEELKQREQQLKEPVEISPYISDLDNYITMRVGLANNRFTQEKARQMVIDLEVKEKGIISKLLELERENPNFENEYMERYMAGRKSVGFNADEKLEGYLAYVNKPIV